MARRRDGGNDPDPRTDLRGTSEERARELAAEQQAERDHEQRDARQTEARRIIREEMREALQELTAPDRPAALRATLSPREQEDAVEQATEERLSLTEQHDRAVLELARRTGGRFGGYSYGHKFAAHARGIGRAAVPSIIERLQGGDPTPAERVIKYFRAITEGNIAEARKWGGSRERALGEVSLGAGGALVPEEFAQDVIAKLGELTPFASREFMRIVPMGTDRKVMPRVITLPEATYQDTENTAWSTDEAKGTEPSFGDVELIARDAVLIVPAAENLFDDASVDLLSFLVDLFADALARLRNNMILNGNGTSQPEGVYTSPSVTSSSYVNTDPNTKQDSVLGQFHDVPPQYRTGAIWVAADSVIETLSKIRDTQARPLLTQLMDEPFMRLRGKPVFETAASPAQKSLFGNFLFYLFGDRMQMQAATDRGGVFFKRRQMAIRVVERYDGKIAQEEAFAIMDSIT